MNQKRRELLGKAVKNLEQANNIVNVVMDEEQSSLDNMPENLQESEKCMKMENALDNLQDAADCIDKAIDSIRESAG